MTWDTYVIGVKFQWDIYMYSQNMTVCDKCMDCYGNNSFVTVAD